MGSPVFLQVLDNVLSELKVQRIYLAEEIKTQNPKQLAQIQQRFPKTPIVFIAHAEMKQNLQTCQAFIRTGEMTPYSNIILESGVTF